jgi:hypothetical protein
MYLNANTATYNTATLAWELNNKVKDFSFSLDIKGAIVKMMRNRAIDARIRRVQVLKAANVWHTVNTGATQVSINRVAAEQHAILKMERMKY